MSKGNKELIQAINYIEREKGVTADFVFESLEAALDSAYKKNYRTNNSAQVLINRKTGDINVYAEKQVVEEVFDDNIEISLEEAQLVNPNIQIDEMCTIEVTPSDFGRIAAQTAKNVVVQRINVAEREVLYEKYKEKENEIYNAVVQRRDGRNIIVTIDEIEAKLPPQEQIPGERFERNETIQVYVTEVKNSKKGHAIIVSRTHGELVRRLFEQNVTEIFDGTVEIKSIAREAGSRTKIAVYSRDRNVDPVGACVGQNGLRVNSIVNALKGEKIDIVKWYEDARLFIAEALNPSEVLAVELNEEEKSAKVVVPDDQLSLAIGKVGQNARLAVHLTNWKIDIKGESMANELGFVAPESYDYRENALANMPVENDEYYDDEYFDDEYYDDEYYDEEYYDEENVNEEYSDDEYEEDEIYSDEESIDEE